MKETKIESANLDLDIHLACIPFLTHVKKINRLGKTHYIRDGITVFLRILCFPVLTVDSLILLFRNEIVFQLNVSEKKMWQIQIHGCKNDSLKEYKGRDFVFLLELQDRGIKCYFFCLIISVEANTYAAYFDLYPNLKYSSSIFILQKKFAYSMFKRFFE